VWESIDSEFPLAYGLSQRRISPFSKANSIADFQVTHYQLPIVVTCHRFIVVPRSAWSLLALRLVANDEAVKSCLFEDLFEVVVWAQTHSAVQLRRQGYLYPTTSF
jgi:hypothetical protein